MLDTEDKDSTIRKILQDVKRGKVQPWRSKKVKSLKLADSLHRLGEHKKANRVWHCCNNLAYKVDPETGARVLHSADNCRERLCPLCAWRRSKKLFVQISKVMDKFEQQKSDLVPVFLTLTVRNCSGEELPKVLDGVFAGWKNFIDHYKIRKLIKGWFRGLEITYYGDKVITEKGYQRRKEVYDKVGLKPGDINPYYDTFHPHIHVILLVEKSYFSKDNKDYMQTAEWVQMWRTTAKLSYDPICWIEGIKANKGKHKPIAEVAKYTLKDTDFLTNDNETTDRLVGVLGGALKGRRLFAFGGLLKKIAKEIGQEELGEGDLVHIDEESIREDVATLIEVYRWDLGQANYLLKMAIGGVKDGKT